MFGVAPLTRFIRDHISPELADKIVQVYRMSDEASDVGTTKENIDEVASRPRG
jgi:hypothetical protein